MDHLHWQNHQTATNDSHHCTSLGHPGWHDKKRNDHACVVLPKVATASKKGHSITGIIALNFAK
jgi:hypothetical protein